MQLRYTDAKGKQRTVRLGSEPIVIGRASEADITINDKRISRRHCEIRLWDGDHIIKDLHSQNGMLVNNEPINIAQLRPRDRITVGGTIFTVEEKGGLGDSTAVHEIESKMDVGKGFHTIMHEIVRDSEGNPIKEE